MAVFTVQSLIVPVKQNEINEAYKRVIEEYKKKEPKSEQEIETAVHKYPYPSG
jgi:hypothetical protein